MNIKIVQENWVYSKKVKDHFFHPRNLADDSFDDSEYNGVGTVGSPACGDVMKIWLKIDPKTDKILDCKWQTFGCASAIASTSMLSTMVNGMKVDNALKIKPQDILDKLGGLPPRKVHCSVLGDKALREAINNYRDG